MMLPQRPPDTPDLVVVVSPPAGHGGRATPLRLAARADAGELVVSSLVGRDPACGVCLDDPAVSRAHTRIEVRRTARAGYALMVTDQGGPGGTRKDGHALAPLRPTAVEDGAAVDVVGWTLTLRLDAARGFTSDSQVGDAPAQAPALPLEAHRPAPATPRTLPPAPPAPRQAWALRALPWAGLVLAAYALWVARG